MIDKYITFKMESHTHLSRKLDSPQYLFSKILLIVLFLAFLIPAVHSQSCTVNAGGNAIICSSTTTLVGGIEGTAGSGGPIWTFISGPVTPTIASPFDFTTDVTGMTVNGEYVFELSHACGTGVGKDRVTITARARPASFTAGPDVTGICATVGTASLAGVIPAGFRGEWRSVNIYSSNRFGNYVSTNSSLSSTTSETPTFELINKANHEIDPAYWAILKITSEDGYCTYEDTTVVRFVPNPIIVPPLYTETCRIPDVVYNQHYLDLVTDPTFDTNYPGSAGSIINGTEVILNMITQPVGGSISFNRLSDTRRLYFDGMDVDGLYRFTLTVTNSCGTYTTPEIDFIYRGTQPRPVNFQVVGHPEQMVEYAGGETGGEVHCSDKVGTTTPEIFYFDINPLDNAADVTISVENEGINPPGGAPSISVTGAGLANRLATITPPAGGWQVGTYAFKVRRSYSDVCAVPQNYYIHISDSARPNVTVADQSICYPGTGAISATIQYPDVYQGVVNSSYFQDFWGVYDISVVSKPAGAGEPTFGTADERLTTLTSTRIDNLTTAGDYVFRIKAEPIVSAIGAFLEAEYACSGTSLTSTFTIHVENIVNANAGTDQTGACAETTLLGNNPGAGAGVWSLVSAPAGSAPNILNPSNASTSVSDMAIEGVYTFRWNITSPLGGCNTVDDVTYTVSSTPPTLNGTTIGSVCPATSVDLMSLQLGAAPAGTTIVWFNNSTHSSTPVTNPSALSVAGTYYAFYLSTGGCYSLPSQGVTVTIDPDCTLPVSLVNFSATVEGIVALLKWETVSESNSKGFEIQRSENAKDWSSIGFVNAKSLNGNSTSRLLYDFTDIAPAKANYYRLKMVDLDETFAYSSIRSVRSEGLDSHMVLYPNPVSEVLFVKNLDINDVTQISITDLTGKSVHRVNSISADGLRLKGIPEGMYFVKIQLGSGETINRKIMIVK